VDGHHRALISTYLGAETIPVRVIADLSPLSPARFEDLMERKGLSYFRNYRGHPTRRVDLCEMQDDPNLELARILIARVSVEFSGDEINLDSLRGKEWAIGVKSDEDLPFLEFLVADALRRAGVEWSDDRDTDLSKRQLKRYLEILKDAVRRNAQSKLGDVLLFDQPERVEDLDLEERMLEHLAGLGCEDALSIWSRSRD
jgi:hypothetical protein